MKININKSVSELDYLSQNIRKLKNITIEYAYFKKATLLIFFRLKQHDSQIIFYEHY